MTDAWDFAEAQADADEMIREAGGPATVVRPGEPAGDAWNPTPGVPARHETVAAFFDYTTRERMANNRIEARDKKALVSALGLAIVPETSDTLEDATGAAWTIIERTSLQPRAGDAHVYHELRVRL